MFENKIVKGSDIHYSRIIASWVNSGGKLNTYKDVDIFEEWLRSTNALNEEQIYEVKSMATNGKLEWEINAKMFLQNHQ